MGLREDERTVSRRRRAALAGALALALAAAGCGGGDDFENEPRPPAPLVVTAKVDDKKVVVSPKMFGAGLVNVTFSNQSDDPVSLTIVGSGTEADLSSREIPPAGVGNLKANLEEGTYEVNGGERSSAKPAEIKVGPPRPNSNDDLLLP